MSTPERMLSDSERETLSKLKKKEQFTNRLMRNIASSLVNIGEHKDLTPEQVRKECKKWFLKSTFWQKLHLTESEYDEAFRLLRDKEYFAVTP
jgi:hypothetical protein